MGLVMINREQLTLIRKVNNEELVLKQCSVQNGEIFSKDIKTPVEEGDVLIRKLPSGLEERYVVNNVLAYTQLLPHYELKVSKL